MSHFWNDCRHALRLYVRTPGASLIAVFVLAVGLAFVGALLSLYVDLVLRPHPGFDQSGRIATIGQNTGTALMPIRYGVVQNMAAEMTSIEAAAISVSAGALTGTERAHIEMVSEEFFSGLRPRLALGRGFRFEDHAIDAEPVVVLSHRYWRQRFNGNPNILGTLVEISRDPDSYSGIPDGEEPQQETARFRVLGVMADALSGLPNGLNEPAMWVPLERAWPIFGGAPERLPDRIPTGTYVRRVAGTTSAAVVAELAARYSGPDSALMNIPGSRLDAIDGIVGDINVQRDAMRQLELLLAGSVLLAIVAAANVSLFVLARAPGRRQELGIRSAVGARTKRLARQLATEAGLLVIVSAVLGLLASVWLSFALRGLPLLREAEWKNVTLLDWRVLSLAAASLLVLTVLVSLAPILGLKRLGIAGASRQIAARASPAQRLAGAAQIAVAGTLGSAAVAFGWYLSVLTFSDPGYETNDRYMIQGSVQGLLIPPQETLIVELARWREAVEGIPGVTAFALGGPVPGEGPSTLFPVSISDPVDPTRQTDVYLGNLERQFIDLLGLRLLHGRPPENGESAVAVVNQTLANVLWGREDVVGERLPSDFRWGNEGAEVIGVLEDISFEHPSAAVKPYVFTTRTSIGSAVVEARLTAAELEQALDRVASGGEIEIAVNSVRPLKTMRTALIAPDRARGFLTIAAASLVVILAAFGFYGTQRYLVAAGRREYAIRAALGAGPSSLNRLVLWRGVVLGLPGLAVGAILAFTTVAWLRDGFVSREVSPGIVATWVAAGLILLLLVASLSPAHEAKRTQPAPLLRED